MSSLYPCHCNGTVILSHSTDANFETQVIQYHVTEVQDLIINLLLYILRASLNTKWIPLNTRNEETRFYLSIYDSYFFSDYHTLSYLSTFEIKDTIFIIFQPPVKNFGFNCFSSKPTNFLLQR